MNMRKCQINSLVVEDQNFHKSGIGGEVRRPAMIPVRISPKSTLTQFLFTTL